MDIFIHLLFAYLLIYLLIYFKMHNWQIKLILIITAGATDLYIHKC